MSKFSVPILMYHALTEQPDSSVHRVHIPVAVFEEQMNWLAAQNYRVLPLAEAVAGLEKGENLPERSVVLTFDDGYLSLHRRARPVLAKLGFPATLFLTTDPVGLPAYSGLSGFDTTGQPAGDRPLTWEELREMVEATWSIEAHSCSHPKLPALNGEKLQHEIGGCKKVIEERLNRPVRYYAYPFGDYNRSALAQVRAAGYKAACSVHVGKAPAGGDVLRLPRIEINTSDDLESFIRKVQTGYASDGEKLRSRVRNVLYASPAVKDLLKSATRS